MKKLILYKKKPLSKGNIRVITLFLLICIGFCFITRKLFHTPILILLKYLLTQLFAVFIPGYAIVCAFHLNGTASEKISLGYTLGYAINICEYFLLYGLSCQRYAIAVIIIVGMFSSVYILFFNYFENELWIDKDWFMLLNVFTIYLFVNIVSYAANAVLPLGKQGMVEISRDVQFWCSNAVSLKLSFPPRPVYLMGGILYYHYFSSIQIAFISRISGIDIFTLAFSLFPLGKCLMMVGGLNFLMNRLQAGNRKLFYLAMILFMTGIEKKSVVTYVWHMITGPFGFDIGFLFGVWFIAFLYLQWDFRSFNLPYFIITMLLWLITVGAKAPIASILIFVPAILCLKWLLCREYKKAIFYGGGVLGIFLIVSIGIAGVMRFVESVDSQVLTLYSLDDIFKTAGLNRVINIISMVTYRIFYSHPVLICYSVINSAMCVYFIFVKKIRFHSLFFSGALLLSAAMGMLMGIFVRAGSGKSEMYFTMAAFIPCITYNAELWRIYKEERVFDRIKLKAIHRLTKLWKVNLIFLTFIGVYNMAFNEYFGGITKSLADGVKKIRNEYVFYDIASFSKSEALVCVWIRDHTDSNSIIISDRNVAKGFTQDYYTGIFTERQQYLEADDLIYVVDLDSAYECSIIEEIEYREKLVLSLYDNDSDALLEIKRKGVNYVIQNDLYTPNFKPNKKFLELVYQSGTISVYRIM